MYCFPGIVLRKLKCQAVLTLLLGIAVNLLAPKYIFLSNFIYGKNYSITNTESLVKLLSHNKFSIFL